LSWIPAIEEEGGTPYLRLKSEVFAVEDEDDWGVKRKVDPAETTLKRRRTPNVER
jgi:hypothetical protein